MKRAKWYLGLLLVGTLLFVGSCTEEPLEVRSAAEAKDVAVTNLQKRESQNAPSSDIVWQEEDVTPLDWVGGVFKEFTSDEWTVKVSYAVLPLEHTVYEVVVFSVRLGWYWRGTVEFDGNVTELSTFRQMSEEESYEVAEEFLRNSATFAFDGIEDTLSLTGTLTARCPYCWVFVFVFECSSAGYGDRTGQAVAQVITLHDAIVMVEQLEITSAVIDGQWDVVSGRLLAAPLVVPLEVEEYSNIRIPIEQFQTQPHIDVVMGTVLGGELTVNLGSNPTTGYQWTEDAEISDASIVKQIHHVFLSPGPDVAGAPGEEVWVFKALKRGTTTILLEYSRSWTGAGLWAVTITATIK